MSSIIPGIGLLILCTLLSPISISAQTPEATVSPSVANADHHEMEELQKQQEQFKKSYELLNQLNPAGIPGSPSSPQLTNSSLGVIPGDGMGKLQGILNSPVTQKLISLTQNPITLKLLEAYQKNQNQKLITIAEGVWIVFILLFRAWRRSKLAHSDWLGGLWIRIWTTGLYMGGAVGPIPYFFLGEPYLAFLKLLYQTLLSP